MSKTGTSNDYRHGSQSIHVRPLVPWSYTCILLKLRRSRQKVLDKDMRVRWATIFVRARLTTSSMTQRLLPGKVRPQPASCTLIVIFLGHNGKF